MKEEIYSPYCPLCQSCGEDGCCAFTNCFSKLVSMNDGCDYGSTYLKDAIFAQRIMWLSGKLTEELRSGETDKEEFLLSYDRQWNEIYDEVYK